MNERDSEFVEGVLLESGFRLAAREEDANIVLFNSCSVRKHAEDRLFSNIAHLKHLKEQKPGLLIGLIGCTAQAYKEKAFKKAPLLDFICGPGNEHELPAIIEEASKKRRHIIATDKVSKMRPELFPEFRRDRPVAYVSISEGCNNYCSYCIVPYVRGRERLRRAEDIVKEVRDLATRGFKEIMLLGQNVNSYGQKSEVRSQKSEVRSQKSDFVKLLESLNNISGIERIRFMTSHPKDASGELFKAMRDLDKVAKTLHLPVQSGSDRILKLMNRNYTRQHYLKLVEIYRNYVPKGEITTDIIVGFPSESGKDFEDTVQLMKKVGFNGAYVFKYSPRPPAGSVKLKDDVALDEKQRRLETILNMQREMAKKRRKT
jgi:tRNA-2-methylthio-N6-dimethylallyladenosine synthase